MKAITGYNSKTQERHLNITSFKEAFENNLVPYDQELKEVMGHLRTYQTHLHNESLARARAKMAGLANKVDKESLLHELCEEVREWKERYNNDSVLNKSVRNWKSQ